MDRRLEDMTPRAAAESQQWFAIVCSCTRRATLSPHCYGYSKAPTMGQLQLQLRCRGCGARGGARLFPVGR